MISVIIPNYNHAPYLKQRIDSVLAQTNKDIELIILDDFSTDDSKQIIEQYRGHPNISHIIYNQSNGGSPFKQWNKGVKLASGQFVWIAESDDYAHPAFLENCLIRLVSNDKIDIVYTDSMEIDENGLEIGRWSRWQEFLNINLWLSDFTLSGTKLNQTYNYVSNIIPNASAVVFRRQSYLDSPFLKAIETLKFTGDWLMWFSIMQRADASYCHQPFNYFRYHSNTTRSNVKGRLENIKEQYAAIHLMRGLVKPQADTNIWEKKFAELYATWNAPLSRLIINENLQILRKAILLDGKLIKRFAKTFYSRLHAF